MSASFPTDFVLLIYKLFCTFPLGLDNCSPPIIHTSLFVLGVLPGVCVRHSDRMAPHLQRVSVLRFVGAERPAAVRRLALRGRRHGPLVRQNGVRNVKIHLERYGIISFTFFY